ncbi:iron-hydroxamate ABC transporter substrate-binding protein [Paenibacillus lentus]|uniref:iron-hydroxamate ABC transporter substrate-binding protein n=1 Tax=Paenibacillus lentus TaxID=1338368 RepID=UPI00365E4058
MVRFLSSQRLVLVCLAMLWLLGGCGSASSGSPASAAKQGEQPPSAESVPQSNEAGDSSATRIFSTVKGDIEIPANPQRIVTQGFLPYFLVFDVKPVGAPSWELKYPHLAGKTDGIEDIGVIEASSLEKILALQPDLIVTVAEEMYDQLSKIAPTVVIPYDTIGDAHKDLRLFGELLGKQEEAEQWLADFDKKVADSKEKINKIVDPDDTFTIVSAFNKTYYIYGDGIYRGGQAIYKYLELKPPAIVKEQLLNTGKDLLEISFEVIPEYAGNHIFLDISNGAEFDDSTSVWQSIDAVKNNRVYKLNVDIFWPYDPLAIYMQLDELLMMLGAEA